MILSITVCNNVACKLWKLTKCPACAELVLPDASVCKHCGTALTPDREYSDRMAAQRLQKQRQADNENLAKVAIAVIALLAFVYFWV